MRRRSPIDEVRNQPIGEHDARIGVRPVQHRAVGALPAAGNYRAEIETMRLRISGALLQRLPFGDPREQMRRLEVVDAESPAAGWPWLFRIGSDDFEVRGRAERYQRVARAQARMLSAWRRADAER